MQLRQEADLLLEFAGVRGGSFEATHGQMDIYRAWDAYRPLPMITVPVRCAIPPGRSLAEACDVVRWLMERFEALRTTYPPVGGSGLCQLVHRSGSLAVARYDIDADPTVLDRSLGAAVAVPGLGRPFDPVAELPVRCSVITARGIPRWLTLEVSHLSLDLEGARALERAIAARWSGLAVPEVEPPLQPADLAGQEQSPGGIAANTRAVAFLDRVLRSAELPLFVPADAARQDRPRWPRARMVSAAIGRAVGLLSQRHRVSPATVYLACMALIVGAHTDAHRYVLAATASNRWSPQTRDYIGTLNQYALIAIDTAGADFPQLLRRMQQASLEAFAHASYDIDAVVALGHTEGVATADCIINNRQRTRTGAAGPLTTEEIRQLRLRTVVEHIDPMPAMARRRSIHCGVRETVRGQELVLSIDQWAVPQADVAGILAGVEQTLVDLAVRPEAFAGVAANSLLRDAAGRWVRRHPEPGT